MTQAKMMCVYCDRDSDQVPLIALRYREIETWICPQHLPILIHRPAQLADKLPGLERLSSLEEPGKIYPDNGQALIARQITSGRENVP